MKHWWLLTLLMLLVGLFFVFDLGRFLTFEALKNGRDELQQAYRTRPLQTTGLYVLLYIAVAVLALPGAGVLTLAGGAIFGTWIGAPLALLSASVGATLAFLMARYVFRDVIQHHFSARMAAIDAGVKRDGAFYLLTLRLVPVFPFFVINLLMGLTAIRTVTFFWASLLGMAPGTAIYANAGTQLGALTGLSDVLSPALIGSFALLAAFPWLARWGVERARRMKR